MRDRRPRQCSSRHGLVEISRCTLNAGHSSVHFEDHVEHEAYRWWLRKGQKPIRGAMSSAFPKSRYTSGAGRTALGNVWVLRLVIAARLARQSRYRARRKHAA